MRSPRALGQHHQSGPIATAAQERHGPIEPGTELDEEESTWWPVTFDERSEGAQDAADLCDAYLELLTPDDIEDLRPGGYREQ